LGDHQSRIFWQADNLFIFVVFGAAHEQTNPQMCEISFWGVFVSASFAFNMLKKAELLLFVALFPPVQLVRIN
jgi:hypothetical protein